MLGYAKREFVGHNVSMCIPEPFGSVHQSLMKRFIRTGKEVRQVDTPPPLRLWHAQCNTECPGPQVMLSKTRVMFFKHRQGHIFPALMHTSVVKGSFVAGIQKLSTSDECIWFYSRSFSVCAASRGSLSLLGVSALRSFRTGVDCCHTVCGISSSWFFPLPGGQPGPGRRQCAAVSLHG